MYPKIAIYWWAFNPPTLGHLHVIEQLFHHTDIEKIIIVPDWLRLDKNYNIDEFHRKEMVELFMSELKKIWYNVELDDYFLQWRNKKDTTTYEVDKYFINKLDIQPWHIFWTDISWCIRNWSWNPKKYIEKNLKKVFIPREWYIFENFDLENYILLDTNKTINISSTMVKEKTNREKDISKMVIKNIENYIIKNNLYQ